MIVLESTYGNFLIPIQLQQEVYNDICWVSRKGQTRYRTAVKFLTIDGEELKIMLFLKGIINKEDLVDILTKYGTCIETNCYIGEKSGITQTFTDFRRKD